MMHIAELTAAPHFPQAMRPIVERNAITDFIEVLNGPETLAIVDENGELHLIPFQNHSD